MNLSRTYQRVRKWFGPTEPLAPAYTRVAQEHSLVVSQVCIVLVTLGLLGVLARVFQLQVQPGARVQELTGSQLTEAAVDSRRGMLLDRHGRILASSRLAYRVFADPPLIEDLDTFCLHVGTILNQDPAEIAAEIAAKPNSRFIVLAEEVSEQQHDYLKRLGLKGLGHQRWIKRVYPHGPLAGQLLGFIGRDGKGLEGLERLYDAQLRPTTGKLNWLRDAQRRPLWIDGRGYVPPTEGQHIRLSLDVVIQSHAEAALGKACETYEAPSGQLVVLRPRTGEILAMANYPPFDPNDFSSANSELWRNRCVTDVYEPGSTFKPFVWGVATEMRVAYLSEMIDCTESGRHRTSEGRWLKDSHALGIISWQEVLVQSSNIGMAIVAERMGIPAVYASVRAFGFGETTGSKLPGEIRGIVNPQSQWNHYSLTSVPMGHEVAVTPLQLVRGFATLCNEGYLVTPTIEPVTRDIMPVEDEDQEPVERALSVDALHQTLAAMRLTVTNGTGGRAKSTQYSIFGKTGTTQAVDPVNGGYRDGEYVASFVAGAPLNDPELAVVCVVHNPNRRKGFYGGTVAAPAVRDVIEKSLRYMGLPPDLE